MRVLSLFVGIMLLWSATVSAQTPVVAPNYVDFTASPDHAAVVSGTSTPVLTDYLIQVSSGTTLVMSQTIGKPTPNAQGVISVPVASIPSWGSLSQNVLYTVKVAAVGSNGLQSVSGASNPFVVPPTPAAPGVPVAVKR